MTTAPRHIFLTGKAGFAVLLVALIGTVLITSTNTANATAVQSASPTAISVVNLSKLLEGLDERKFLEADLNKEIDLRQAELNGIVDEIKLMQEDIKLLVEGDPKTIQMIRDFRLKQVQAKALSQFVQEQLSYEKGKMLATIYKKIQNAVCDIVTRDGWDIVMIDDSGPDLPELATEQQMNQLILSRRILCSAKGVDITEHVKTLMNNQFNAARP